MAIILLLTLSPGGGAQHMGLKFIDKFVHMGLFSVFSFLMVVGLKKQNAFHKLNTFLLVIAFSTVLGSSIEIVQEFVPGRDFDWLDILSNFSGTILGIFIYYMIYKI